MIEAPDAGAVGGDDQKDKAIKRDGLSVIVDREKADRAMHQPIAHRGHPAAKKSTETREQPDGNQQAAYQLYPARRHGHGIHLIGKLGREAKDLLGAMGHEQKAGDDPKNRIGRLAETLEHVRELLHETAFLMGPDDFDSVKTQSEQSAGMVWLRLARPA